MAKKLDTSDISEIGRHFHPLTKVVDKLPDPKQSVDLQEHILDNKDGTFTKYQMINGQFRKGSTYS